MNGLKAVPTTLPKWVTAVTSFILKKVPALAFVFLALLVLIVPAFLWSPPHWIGNRTVFEQEAAGRCGAKADLDAFHVLHDGDIAATPLPGSTKEACAYLTGHVLLHAVGKDTPVSGDDVGPAHIRNGGEVVTIRIVKPLNSVFAGDVVDLLIEPGADPAAPVAVANEGGATPGCDASSSRRLMNATVLDVGDEADNGLLAMAVAIPLEPASNLAIVDRIERNSIFTVVYKMGSTPDLTHHC